jgi:hypothetical protein
MSALEKKRMRDQLVGMENDWIQQNSAKGIPAREMTDAMHRAAAKFE